MEDGDDDGGGAGHPVNGHLTPANHGNASRPNFPKRQPSYTDALQDGIKATKNALVNAGRQSTYESTRILSELAPQLFGRNLLVRQSAQRQEGNGGQGRQDQHHHHASSSLQHPHHARRRREPSVGPLSKFLQSLSPLGHLTQPLTRPVTTTFDSMIGSSKGPMTLEEVSALLLVDEVVGRRFAKQQIGSAIHVEEEVTPLWRGYTATASEHRRKTKRLKDRIHRGLGPSALGSATRKRLGGSTPNGRHSPSANGLHIEFDNLTLEDLIKERNIMIGEKENLQVRKNLIHSEIVRVEEQIQRLVQVRDNYEKDVLTIHESDLLLDDEVEKLTSRISSFGREAERMAKNSRRWIGSLFMPSEHDDLPKNVAFMTIRAHSQKVNCIDMTHPYGLVVSASEDGRTVVTDLSTGAERTQLRGHSGNVRSLQIQDDLCVTGSDDMTLRIWDLDQLEESLDEIGPKQNYIGQGGEEEDLDFFQEAKANGGMVNGLKRDESNHGFLPSLDTTDLQARKREKPQGCRHILEGHSGPVTSLYFEDNCLVTGAGDKTMRQWDLTTGQCVLTMDILWAMNSIGENLEELTTPDTGLSSSSISPSPETPKRWKERTRGEYRNITPSGLGTPTPGWGVNGANCAFDWSSPDQPEEKDEVGFVGGLQFWGCALASGTIDGAIRMWDMRTGQSHRTLIGHLGPITSLQFDELHLISASLDRSVRLWDLRTGKVVQHLSYDEPVLKLQFDTRRIWTADGQAGPTVYNRVSEERSTMTVNGHDPTTDRVTSLRCIDSYCITGGRAGAIKAWAV